MQQQFDITNITEAGSCWLIELNEGSDLSVCADNRLGNQIFYFQAIHGWADLHWRSSRSQVCCKQRRDLVQIAILADLRFSAYPGLRPLA